MKRVVWSLLIALSLTGAPAHALCLAPICTCALSTSSIVFPAYNPISSGNTDARADLRIDCGGVAGLLIPYNIALSTGGGGSYANGMLSNGSNRLRYNLFTDNTYSTLWGDGSGGSIQLSSSILLDVLGLALPRVHSMYARIPGGQRTAVPGVYSDAITVTVTYF